MSVSFEVLKDKGYYISKFSGLITDEELCSAYQQFLESAEWSPGLNELADLSQLNAQNLSSNGLQRLSNIFKNNCEKFNIKIKSAVYAPNDLSYGLARIYKVHVDGIENNMVFRDIDTAIMWLENN